ncbi:MAG: glutamate--tRNA ligase [Candidatus Hepatoplasma vulgare]|nr:MAG: glutamate--tRNA ligase [Candidatus Hepatoplasma sp.]
MKKEVITRYAPSPTGKFHIGGARTALFNYLFAKANNGIFILRIEDTDIKRNQEGKENDQIDYMFWLNVVPDLLPGSIDRRAPFKQSERLDFYHKYANFLLEKKLAYKCYCTEEELKKSREEQLKKGITSPQYNLKCYNNPPKNVDGKSYSIRLHVPNDLNFEWEDRLRGKISIPSSSIGDWVILKSDKQPTYNFANVIDDHFMGITHVMRGEEHLTNTAKQVHLYKLFNWDIPEFIHLTIIVNSEKKKLSKRDESVMQFVSNYKERGYLPEAVFNFLAFLGWSSKNEKEIYSKEELIKIFNLDGLSKAPSQFDIQKLKWINNLYIQKLEEDSLYNFLSPFVKDIKIPEEQKKQIFNLFKSQLKEGIEIKELINLFTKKILIDNSVKEIIKNNKQLFVDLFNELNKLNNWEENKIKEIIDKIGYKLNLKGRNLLYPLRYVFTNEDSGPPLVKILYIFGKEKTMNILEKIKF